MFQIGRQRFARAGHVPDGLFDVAAGDLRQGQMLHGEGGQVAAGLTVDSSPKWSCRRTPAALPSGLSG